MEDRQNNTNNYRDSNRNNRNRNNKFFDKNKKRKNNMNYKKSNVINMREMLESGCHFGHYCKMQNPKMKEYIFTKRDDGTSIIDLHKTLDLFDKAYLFAKSIAAKGEHVLFVGTRRQVKEIIKDEASRSKMHYVNHRWLGGMLTNWATVKESISKLNHLDELHEIEYAGRSKREALKLEKARQKLLDIFGGIRNMDGLPKAIFIVDAITDGLAIAEARRLKIPTIALVDTDADPDIIDWVIPANDDAIKSVRLFTSKIADACIAGYEVYQQKIVEDARKMGKDLMMEEVAGPSDGKQPVEDTKETEEVTIPVVKLDSKNRLKSYISP